MTVQFGTSLRWVELSERLRTAEAQLLSMLALLREITPDLASSEAATLAEHSATSRCWPSC